MIARASSWRRLALIAVSVWALASCLLIVDPADYETTPLADGGGETDGTTGGGGDGTVSPDTGGSAFSIGATPDVIVLHVGEVLPVDIAITRAQGFTGEVVVAPSAAPAAIDVARDAAASTRDRVRFLVTGRSPLVTTPVSFVATSGNATASAIVRITVDPPPGSLDREFGDGGVMLTTQPASDTEMGFDPRGRFNVVSYYNGLYRFEPDGGRDYGFGDGGYVDAIRGGGYYAPLAFDDQQRITVTMWNFSGSNDPFDHTAARYAQTGDPAPGSPTAMTRSLATRPPPAAGASGAGGEWFLTRTATTDAGFTCPCVFQIERYAPDARVDPSFQFDGGPPSTSSVPRPTELLPYPDGRLLVSGTSLEHFAALSDQPVAFTLLRTLPSGAPDPAFGDGGRVNVALTPPDAGFACNSMTRHDDAGFLVAGFVGSYCSTETADPTSPRIVVLHVLENGKLDPAFGDAGAVLLPAGDDSYARAVAFQPDGKILVAGARIEGQANAFVVRLNPNGSFDPTFHDGTHAYGVSFPIGFRAYVRDVAYVDGRIVVGGVYQYDSAQGDRTRVFMARIVP